MNFCGGFNCVHSEECNDIEKNEYGGCDNVDCKSYGCNACYFVTEGSCPSLKNKGSRR